MVTVTDGYKSAVYSTSRKTSAKVEFEILDVDANTDATATVTSEASMSKKTQIYNQVRQMTSKYATFENEYWKLDGTFALPPKSAESGFEVGWWSDALSGSDGTFSTAQVLTNTFTINHSSIGLTITFDTLNNEYAKDFQIDVYNSSDVVIYTTSITDNTLSQYILEQNLSDFRKVKITITKWANAYRRARITEVDFGIIQVYDGDTLINLNVIEEIDTINSNLTSNEVKFTIDNSDQAFNILNPTGLYPYLQRRQKIKPLLGIERDDLIAEYVPMGTYYLTEWKSDEGTLTASFTARDMLDILSQSNYAGASFSSKTLTYVAQQIFSSAGVTDYNIDSALSSITTSGSIAECTHREALQLVAIAGMAVCYCDRNGTIQIKQLSSSALTETIDFDNVYASPSIELDKLINTVRVNSYTYVDPNKPSNEETLLVEVDNDLITTNEDDVAEWILNEYKKRYLYTINWRQNPALECGDIVTVEDEFSENKTMRITKQEFDFQGYLAGKTSGKGDGT